MKKLMKPKFRLKKSSNWTTIKVLNVRYWSTCIDRNNNWLSKATPCQWAIYMRFQCMTMYYTRELMCYIKTKQKQMKQNIVDCLKWKVHQSNGLKRYSIKFTLSNGGRQFHTFSFCDRFTTTFSIRIQQQLSLFAFLSGYSILFAPHCLSI